MFLNSKIFVDSKTRTCHEGSGRGGARRSGGAGRGRVGRDADGSVRPGDNRPSCPPGHRRQCFERLFRKREQSKAYVNRWRNKIRG